MSQSEDEFEETLKRKDYVAGGGSEESKKRMKRKRTKMSASSKAKQDEKRKANMEKARAIQDVENPVIATYDMYNYLVTSIVKSSDKSLIEFIIENYNTFKTLEYSPLVFVFKYTGTSRVGVAKNQRVVEALRAVYDEAKIKADFPKTDKDYFDKVLSLNDQRTLIQKFARSAPVQYFKILKVVQPYIDLAGIDSRSLTVGAFPEEKQESVDKLYKIAIAGRGVLMKSLAKEPIKSSIVELKGDESVLEKEEMAEQEKAKSLIKMSILDELYKGDTVQAKRKKYKIVSKRSEGLSKEQFEEGVKDLYTIAIEKGFNQTRLDDLFRQDPNTKKVYQQLKSAGVFSEEGTIDDNIFAVADLDDDALEGVLGDVDELLSSVAD